MHTRAHTDSKAPSRPEKVQTWMGRRIVEATNQPNATIRYVETDLGVLASIRKAVSDVQGMNIMLKLLVNAAGVFAPEEHLKSQDCVDLAFAVNFVGPVLLMQLLHPLLRKVFVHVCARGGVHERIRACVKICMLVHMLVRFVNP